MPPHTASKDPPWIVVTTINAATPALEQLMSTHGQHGRIVIVGDVSTPSEWERANVHYLSVDKQIELFGEAAANAPRRHYARKNFGYLYALSQGATAVLDTDDDTFVEAGFGHSVTPDVLGRSVGSGGWMNCYAYFADGLLWPRGLPLDEIGTAPQALDAPGPQRCIIHQYLIDGDTDVDAIHRLVCPNENVVFSRSVSPVVLENRTITPFNSQNTVFFKAALPLLYLPSHCSFRMTDIWRSFVAQGALWASGHNLAVCPPTSHQVRNPHDLMKDFRDEVPGYLENKAIVRAISEKVDTLTQASPAAAAHTLWTHLVEIGVLPKDEQPLIDNWFNALSDFGA